jgi:hypothetical protein
MSSCLDLTGPKSIARTTLDGMSASHKHVVDLQINKSLKKKTNQEVKGAILDIAHRELLDELLIDETPNPECRTSRQYGSLPKAHDAGINGYDKCD